MQTSKYGGIFPSERDEQHNNKLFWLLVIIAQLLAIFICFVVGFWIAWYLVPGDFPAYPAFSYHPIFMTLAMVFLVGEGAIIHRILRPYLPPIVRVTIHFIIMATAFCIAVAGLNAIFKILTTHMGNAHTWIGMMAVIALSAQLLFGFLAFYFPGSSSGVHDFYKPLHRFFGGVIFAFAAAAALMGVTMETSGKGLTGVSYALSVSLVLGIAAYAVTVMAILIHPDFHFDKRRSEEAALLSRVPAGSTGDQPRKQSLFKSMLEWRVKSDVD